MSTTRGVSVAGPAGPTGGTGATGASTTWLHGTGVPSSGLGNNGDFYLNDVNQDVYYKASGTWSVATNIKGDPGDDGADGSSTGLYTYTEPAFASVSTLHHFNGSNGSTTITDQVAGNTWTCGGSAALSTTSPAVGSASLLVPASGNSRISMPTNSKFNVGAGDWAIEFRYKYSTAPQAYGRFFQSRDGDVVSGWSLCFDTTTQNLLLGMSSNASSNNIFNGTLMTLPTTGWCEVLIAKRGNSMLAFLDGANVYNGTCAGTLSPYYNAADTVVIGGQSGTARSIGGYLDEFRFIKGEPVITANRMYSARPAHPDS